MFMFWHFFVHTEIIRFMYMIDHVALETQSGKNV